MPKNSFTKIDINLNLNVRGLRPSATLEINEKSKLLLQECKNVYRLGLGQSPFPVPESVVESLRRNAGKKEYLPVRGLHDLRESVAAFNARVNKVKCSSEDIMIGPGSKELIFILQLVFYGDLIIPTPSWVSYFPQARIIGRQVHWVPTEKSNEYRLSPEKLDLICRSDPDRPRIVILNYPSNPTGATYKIEKLKELAAVARKYRLVLISDEIYGMVNHNGNHVSIARYYPEGTIISSGLSKWCGAGGWRLGTFTFPPALRWLQDAMAIVASETYTATSAPIQYAAVTAFEGNNEIDEYLVLSRKVLKAIAKKLGTMLDSMNVKYPKTEGAFYLFPDFEFYKESLNRRGIYTSVEFCERLIEETGIAMLPGSDFGRQPEELTTRIAYVDFNGQKALEEAKMYNGNVLDDIFINRNCKRMLHAFDRLKTWLEDA